jgi:hypothetical protein
MALFGNAHTVDQAAAQQDYARLLGQDEQVYAAYLLIRDTIAGQHSRRADIAGRGTCPRYFSSHRSLLTVWRYGSRIIGPQNGMPAAGQKPNTPKSDMLKRSGNVSDMFAA